MSQTRLGSAIESTTNVIIGIGVALASQLVIFTWFGIHVPLSTNLWMSAWFTVISLIRSYVVRRWFNRRLDVTPFNSVGAGVWHWEKLRQKWVWVPDKPLHLGGPSGPVMQKGSTGPSLLPQHSIGESFDY